MYLEITVLWARIIEIKSLSRELTFLHFPPIEINFKNWAWISSNSRQLYLSMGRNYAHKKVETSTGASVKCLCFPLCLPCKDLHILTHYETLWCRSPSFLQLGPLKLTQIGAFCVKPHQNCLFFPLLLLQLQRSAWIKKEESFFLLFFSFLLLD